MSRARGSYDAVVVGGGHNGLVAAAYLARAGRSCLVLERRSELGGAVASASPFPGVDARVSRYAYLVSLMPRLIIDELDLPLAFARRRVSSYTPDPRAAGRRGLLVDADDPARTRASFEAVTRSARAHAAWSETQERLQRLAGRVFPTLTEPLRSRAQLRALGADDATWDAIFETPLGDRLLPVLGDDLVAGVALSDALIGTFAAAGDADLRQNRCFLLHVIGGGSGEWLVPVGGMGAVTAALAGAARGAGAELLTGAEVAALEPDARGAGVRFSRGEREREVRARRVLVNAAPGELERLLGAGVPVADVPARDVPARDARARDVPAGGAPGPEGSQLKLNLVLERLPKLLDRSVSPDDAFAGTFHVNETAGQLQAAYEEAAAGAIPLLPPCEAYCHSLTDPSILGPSLRAAGAHTLTIFALQMPARLFATDPEGARDAALQATMRSLDSVLAEPIAECVLRDSEGRPCVEVHSPLDLERELRMPGGHIFHRDLAWPFAEGEHEPGSWGVETAHPAIVLCGAGARRGGGVSGVPGRNAAMALLA